MPFPRSLLALMLIAVPLEVASGTPAGDATALENDLVRIVVDPSKGGAISSMVYKKATTFPAIEDKGAGLAGRGAYFAVSGEPALRLRPAAAPGRIILEGSPEPGLTVERTIMMAPGESGFRIADQYRSERDRTWTIQGGSLQQAEPWRAVARSWYGDEKTVSALDHVSGATVSKQFQSGGPGIYWRMVGPHGVGFLFQATAPSPARIEVRQLKDPGIPILFEWKSGGIRMAAGQALTVESSVLIDEGGREPRDRTGVSLDLREATKPGETIPGQATVVSETARRLKLILRQGYRKESTLIDPKPLGEYDLDLDAGRGRILLFEATPGTKGLYGIEAELRDLQGAVVGRAQALSVVDGEGMLDPYAIMWKHHLAALPEESYRGTWSQIGAQLAKAGRLKPKAADARAAGRLAFYSKKFPYYAELLKGAAETLHVRPEEFAVTSPVAMTEACMNILFTGPDGPLNAFSKERPNPGCGGLGYLKMVPDQGYRYQLYTLNSWSFGYGINSEGLSTSGASINCDEATTRAGRGKLAAWTAAGKPVAPIPMHLMLATCRNVEEAIRFIEDPEAPFDFEGNMMIVDRSGNAARLESVGLLRQIHRHDPRKDRFFVAGNYPHASPEGLFKIGADWGWAANTMRRELLLEELAGARQGQLTFKDAVALMETHAAGGMCQHHFENCGRLYTNTSFLAVPRTGELWLSHGPPCRVRYTRYTLD